MPARRSYAFAYLTAIAIAVLLLSVVPALSQQKDGSTSPVAAGKADAKAKVAANYGHIPLSFEANRGQTDPSVQFLSRGQGYTLFLRPDEAVLALRSAKPRGADMPLPADSLLANPSLADPRGSDTPRPADSLLANPSPALANSALENPASAGPRGRLAPNPGEVETSLVRMKLVGANAHAAVHEEDQQITKTNYFIGNDPKKWRTDVPNFGRVRYAGIYPGIDLVYYGNQSKLEHDFVVAPGVNPGQIRLAMEGAKKLAIDPATGDLVVSTGKGEVRLLKPITYQESNGQRTPVSSTYKLLAKNQIGFEVTSYNHAQPLVIDPVLVYSTFLGGPCPPLICSSFRWIDPPANESHAIAVDSTGNAYITGETWSQSFPVTAGAFQTLNAGDPILGFVAKLDPTGSNLVYATYLGGTEPVSQCPQCQAENIGFAIQVDKSGNAYVAGYTFSKDFPVTAGAFQTVNNDLFLWTGFVTKLNATGSALDYSTYLGGSGIPGIGGDYVTAMSIDGSGNVYAAGATSSLDFPVTTGAFQKTFPASPQKCSADGVSSGFVTKLNSGGNGLLYSTYLGGSCYDSIGAIAVDDSGNAYVTGGTYSTDFPVTSAAFQTTPGDAFVAKLNPQGTGLVYSTFFPAEGSFADDDWGWSAIAIDAAGDAFIAGAAFPGGFPATEGAFQKTSPIPDSYTGFVAEFDPNGSSLVYATLLGGSLPGIINAMALDGSGNVYLAGGTASSDFPLTANAFQRTGTGILTELNATGSALVYSSYGPADSSNAIALGATGDVYISGSTGSSDLLVTPGAFEKSAPAVGYLNGFVARLDLASAEGGISTSTRLAVDGVSTPLIPLLVTASVKANSGSAATGIVDFRMNGQVVGTVPLDSSGNAELTLSGHPPDNYTIAANYEGDSTFNPSADDQMVTIYKQKIVAIGGTRQVTSYGTSFSQPLVVQLLRPNGTPLELAGIPVTFGGAGLSFSSTSVMTDANGQAQVTATPTQAGRLAATATIADGPNATSSAVFNLICPHVHLHVSPTYPQFPGTIFRYGDTIPTPTAYTITGFVNGDTEATAVTGAPVMWTTATPTSPVGGHKIYISQGTLAAQNYYFWFYPSVVWTYGATLSLTANSFTIQQGQPIPNLTYSISGFVNGDSESIVTGAPVFILNATSSSPPGVYPITILPGTLAAPNYGFPYSLIVNGTLTIQ